MNANENSEGPKLPVIVHIVYALDYGGLENGLVNLLNRLPLSMARHVIIALTTASNFSSRISNPNVQIFCLHKPIGQTYRIFGQLYRLLKSLKPDIVHTRNLTTLECQLVAFIARVPARIHSEHGWDVSDPDGSNLKHILIRRFMRWLVHAQIGLSSQIIQYLHEKIAVPSSRLIQICNGVDTVRFTKSADLELDGCNPYFKTQGNLPWSKDAFVIGSVGRIAEIKNQELLCVAFVRLVNTNPQFALRGKLAIIGNGPLLEELRAYMAKYAPSGSFWLPGSRDDIPDFFRNISLFALPSHAEGISNSILEAMASGIPTIAGNVGGNGELIVDDINGYLIAPQTVESYCHAINRYFTDAPRLRAHGLASRSRATQLFSIEHMAKQYKQVYESFLK